MAALYPLKVTIENFPNESAIELDVPDFPTDPAQSATHKVFFDKVVFIDSVDFHEVMN